MLRKLTPMFSILLAAGSVWLFPGEATAQDVQWRQDYNAARKEAKEKGLPLVIDFYLDTCVPCKIMEHELRRPDVAKQLGEQFIPVRLNGQMEANKSLVEFLRINSYPTVLFADADGKILGTMIGFNDINKFTDSMQRALAQVANPEWMVRDYQEAVKAFNQPDYARAVTLLRGVVQDGKTRPVQQKSSQLLADIEKQAATKLAKARQLMDKGEQSAAVPVLTDLIKGYAGTRSADEATLAVTGIANDPKLKEKQRVGRARDLLAQAKEEYRTKQYIICLDRCETLINTFGDLEEGQEASQLAAEIKSNPEWLQSACDTLAERLSNMYLDLAESYLRKAQPKQATMWLERVISSFPSSRQAEVAQIRLNQLRGQPTTVVDFKKN
jgi:thiol-disulfide isomerase/thioredoxin